MPRLTNTAAKRLKFDCSKICPACQRRLEIDQYRSFGEKQKYIFEYACKPCGHHWTEEHRYTSSS